MYSKDELFQRIAQFDKGELRRCPFCDAEIDNILLKPNGPHTDKINVATAQPCGHQLGLWIGVPGWVVEAGLISHE